MNLHPVLRIRRAGRYAPALVLALIGAVASAPLRAEGTQTGVLAGRVLDAEGRALPGVSVRALGPRGARTTVTDDSGRFRLPATSPGSWSVSAELFDLVAGPTEASVHVGGATELELRLGEKTEELEAGTDEIVEDWVQVVAQAPLLDPWDPGVGTSLTWDFVDDLPVARFYQSFALLLPGVSGGEDGNPNTSGSLRSSNLALVDGVDTTDPTTGLFGLNLAVDAVQEVEVTTAAIPAEYGRASGAVLNVVTRSGTDRWKGRVRWLASSEEWNADREPDDALRFRHLQELIAVSNSGPDRLDSTSSITLGGPVVRNRLWAFAAWEDSGDSFLHPTEEGSIWNENGRVESLVGKLTARLSESHSFELQHTADDASVRIFAPFDDSPAENRLPQIPEVELADSFFGPIPGDLFAIEAREQEGEFDRLAWEAVPSGSWAIRAGVAAQERGLGRFAPNRRGLTTGAPHVAVLAARPEEPGQERFVLFNGVTRQGEEERTRDQAHVALEWFRAGRRVDHELSFGVDLQETESRTDLQVPGIEFFDADTGEAYAGQLFFDLDLRPECQFLGECLPFDPATGSFQPLFFLAFQERPLVETREETWAFHLTDTISLDRWTWKLGARVENVEATAADGTRLVDDLRVLPRISFTWQPTGTEGTLVSGSWSRYAEPWLHQLHDSFFRFEPLSGFVQFEWTFENPHCDPNAPGVDPSDVGSPCWRPFEIVPPAPLQFAGLDPDLRRSVVDEWVLGYERQLTQTTAISLHVVGREWDDLWDDVIDVVPGTEDRIEGEVRNLDLARREYRGVQIQLQRRFADSWQLLASYTWSETEGNLFTAEGRDSFADLVSVTDGNVVNRHGPAPYDRTHEVGVWGVWKRPVGPAVVTLGSAVGYRDGVPIERRRVFEEGLEERFLTPRGSDRLSGLFQWDLSFGLDVPVPGRMELEARVEVFNVTDEQNQTGATSDDRFFGIARSLGDLQGPRTFRGLIGLRF